MKLFIKLTLVTGLLYPLAMTLISQVVMPHKANGSQIVIDKEVRGSLLIGQAFTQEIYFWPRPSACKYRVVESKGTGLALTSKELLNEVRQRENLYQSPCVPTPLLYASASGLDPHITLSCALFQLDRVVAARHFNEAQKQKLYEGIHTLLHTGVLKGSSEPYINVVELNLLLDRMGT